jgi:hypothetical protein
VFKVDNL